MVLSNEKIWFYGLLVACPEGTPMLDCPLKQFRKLSYKERLSALENFTEEEVDEIITHHNQCLLRRVL